MRGYKFYAVVALIACLTLQEASCARKSKRVQKRKPAKVEGGLNDCDEYKSKIWEKAFSNPEAMKLVDKALETAKKMGTDEVCSDTVRAFFNFVDEIGTNKYALYSMGMFYKMIMTIVREFDSSSETVQETQTVLNRMLFDPEIQELVWLSLNRPIEMLRDNVIRKRLFITLKSIFTMAKPSETQKTFMKMASKTPRLKTNERGITNVEYE